MRDRCPSAFDRPTFPAIRVYLSAPRNFANSISQRVAIKCSRVRFSSARIPSNLRRSVQSQGINRRGSSVLVHISFFLSLSLLFCLTQKYLCPDELMFANNSFAEYIRGKRTKLVWGFAFPSAQFKSYKLAHWETRVFALHEKGTSQRFAIPSIFVQAAPPCLSCLPCWKQQAGVSTRGSRSSRSTRRPHETRNKQTRTLMRGGHAQRRPETFSASGRTSGRRNLRAIFLDYLRRQKLRSCPRVRATTPGIVGRVSRPLCRIRFLLHVGCPRVVVMLSRGTPIGVPRTRW